jgi:hypothetical protein
MKKTEQVNVRFDADTQADLDQTAEALGTSRSVLVRRLTEAFLKEVKRTGSVKLNPTWLNDLGKADARSDWGERKIPSDQDLKTPVVYPKKRQSSQRRKS